jgi:ribosomal protein L29
MDTKEMQQKTDADLVKHLAERREELHKLRFSASGSGMRNTHAIRNARKEIAQTLTELNHRSKKEGQVA